MTNIWTVCYFTIGITCTGAMLLLFKQIFRDKLNARWHYMVWLVLLVRAVLPANVRLFSTSFSLNNLWLGGMKRLRGMVELGRNSLLSAPFGMEGGNVSLLREMPTELWSVTDMLFVVYVAGVLFFLFYDGIVYAKLRRDIRKGENASAALWKQVFHTAKKYELPQPKSVRICGGTETPFLCGLFRPVLVIPQEMAEGIDEKILLHELLHLKYYDVLVNFALHFLRTLNWFNPFVWILCRVIRNDSEALCDQRALECLEGEEKREYGLLLLQMADSRYASRIGTTSMANGAKNIKTRVQRIADFGRVPKGAAFATACITVILSLAAVSYGYEPKYFETDLSAAKVQSKADLELLLEDTRYFTVSSPEMAVNLFAEALTERDLVKMALLVPQEEFDSYKKWVLEQYDMDINTFSTDMDTENLHLYAFCTYVENGKVEITDYEKDRFAEGKFCFRHADWTEEDDTFTEELVSFRLENENGWKMYITDRNIQEISKDGYYWMEGQLYEELQQGEYRQFGDWRLRMAEWVSSYAWSGSGFQGLHSFFFSDGTAENTFSEEVNLAANHAVVVEYAGKMWTVEEWKKEKDEEVPLFVVCPAEMEDTEFFGDIDRKMYHVGGGGGSSDGSGWEVPMIQKDNTWSYIIGDMACDSIDEAMQELERPYEFRIYSRDGERLLTVPFTGGGLYE